MKKLENKFETKIKIKVNKGYFERTPLIFCNKNYINIYIQLRHCTEDKNTKEYKKGWTWNIPGV